MTRTPQWLALGAVVALVVAACGGDAGTGTTAEPGTTAPTETTAPPTTGGAGADTLVGLAYDIGGRGDKSFNDSAAAGLDRAIADFGIQAEELEPTGGGENREENLQLLSEAGANLIFAVGFAFTDGVANVAPNFSDQNYGLIDGVIVDADGNVVELDNVAYLTFAEEQGSALVGCIAGLMTQTGQIGFIGGVNIDLILKFEAGYRFGAETCNPDVQIESRYLTEPPDFAGFSDPALGKEAAVALYDGGADIVYHAAGGSGQGLFEEAAARKASDDSIWAIGVDSDQYETVGADLQHVVLTSMLKRVDVAVYNTIEAHLNGNFTPGIQVFDLAAEGVGYSTSGGFIPEDVTTQVEDLRAQIVGGELEVPATPA